MSISSKKQKTKERREPVLTINQEISKFVNDTLKELGICVRCTAAVAEKNHTLCYKCLLYWRVKYRSTKKAKRK